MTRLILALVLLIPSMAGAESRATKRERIQYVDAIIEQVETGTWSKNFIRAILWTESGWKQYNPNGTTYTDGPLAKNGEGGDDIGIGQINILTILDHPEWDWWLVYADTKYNIECSIQVLNEKQNWVHRICTNEKELIRFHKKFGILGESELSITIMAYNGFKPHRKYPRLVKKYWQEEPWKKYLKKKNGHIYGRVKDAA